MRDGLLGKCKECTKNDSTTRRDTKIEEVRAYDRDRANLPHRVKARKEYWGWYIKAYPERVAEARKNYHQNNPDKKHAHITTGNAIRDGKLIRKPCEICGNPKVEAHHEDYSKPLEVVWLCKPHHFQADARRREREGQKP